MRNIIFTILLLAPAYYASAQKLSGIDSLLQQLPAAKEDSNKAKLLIRIANLYGEHDIKNSEKYCVLANNLSRKINYPEGMLHSYAGWSDALKSEGLYDSCLAVNLESVAYSRKINNQLYLGYSLYNAGISYIKLGQYENAIGAIEESRAIFERLKDKVIEGNIYNFLQVLATNMHQYRKAVGYGLKAIEILQTGNDSETLCQSYNNLGLSYIYVQSYDSAKYYLGKGYEIAQASNIELVKTTYNINHGLIALRLQTPDSLRYYAQNALELSHKNGMHEYESLALYGLASAYLSKKDYAAAKLYADSCKQLADRYNLQQAKPLLYTLLSNYYFAVQNTRLGDYYSQQQELLKDSILNESITKNTIDIEKKYETQRKDDQIRLQQSRLKQQAILNYFLIASAIGLAIISMLSYRNYKSRQKLQQTKIEELERERQLSATEAVLKGEEQERTRLAKELHDGLGGMLSGIKYSFINMKETLPPENTQAFERNLDMLDTSIREMRRVAHNLMPEILIKYGLNAALKEFCNEISRSGVIAIVYQPMGLEKENIDQSTSLAVYRIVQELVHNVIKHAAAKTVLVQIHASPQDGILSVTVEDDGKGFTPATLDNRSGIGWINIQNRIDLLKGRVDISSAPGGGTSVLVEIDIK
ncbi:MAG: sensor histidine kinase [Bacteroidetes bacterium]|nr:sensor histidine kinase [Bacteroidota bacterium]